MSNKIRLIKIYELRGLIHPIETNIIELLDGIEKEPYSIGFRYWKDGRRYFTYYLKTKKIYLSIHFSQVSQDFKTKFGCSYDETMVIMKYLLEKHLNITINEVY